jgi:hypothetical protein
MTIRKAVYTVAIELHAQGWTIIQREKIGICTCKINLSGIPN